MINETNLISEELARSVTDRVLSMREHFTDRGKFHTLGASSYIDNMADYTRLSMEKNPMLLNEFSDLYAIVQKHISSVLQLEVLVHPWGAVPGFHIFGTKSNSIQGHVHVDEPYQRILWPEPFYSPFTFTLALNVPGKAGLDVWLDQEQLTPIYIDYKVGHLYSHAGLIQHRISKVGEVTDENPRITLQGHGAILGMSNKAVVYF